MDIQTKDILKQLLERLDKMDSQQHKLDRVMERLDTLQNIIERQNQKQNLLDEKLVEITIRRQQEKSVMAEQFQDALQEIIEPFDAIDSQEVCTSSPHKTTRPLKGAGTQIGDSIKSIENRTVDTAEKCHQLTLWSRKIEDKIADFASNSVEMKTFLVEMRSVKDLIKGQTNAELIWLNGQIDKKLSDIGSIVRDIYHQQTETKDETVRSTGQRVKTDMQHRKQQGNTNDPLGGVQLATELHDKQMQVFEDLHKKVEHLNSSVLNMSRDVKTSFDTILTTNKQLITDLENRMSDLVEEINESSKGQSYSINETQKSDFSKYFEAVQAELQTNTKTIIKESETQTRRIISFAETANDDLRHLIQTDRDNTCKYKVELGHIFRLITAYLDSIQGNVVTVGKRIDSIKASMTSRHQTVMQTLKEYATLTAVNTKFEELTNDLKVYIYKTKREMFAVTEKEAQIVRDSIQGSLPSLGKYTFDFYLNNFKMLVRSGKGFESLPCHINEAETCVTGLVRLPVNGNMEVWLMYRRHPIEVGLKPRPCKTLKVKATICDIYNRKLPPLDVGEVSSFLNEEGIHWNGGVGNKIGVISGDVLLRKGYGEQEGYYQGAVLIRYEVTVQ